MDILLYPLMPFVAMPWLTLLPVAIFAIMWLKKARTTQAGLAVAVAAIGWAVYAAWEISFVFRPVREWIRIELLIVAPLLLLVSLWALVALYRQTR